MADDVVRASVLGRVLWRGRRLLIALAVLGAGLGALAWILLPQSFTASTKVLLQGASDETDISTAAQVAMGRVVVQRAITGLGWDPRTVGEDAVTAEATQGSVITITATASDPGGARNFAAQVTKEYIAFSTEVADAAAHAAADALRGRREDLQRQISELDDAIGSRSDLLAPTGALDGDQTFLLTRRSELLQALHEVEQQIATARAEAAVGAASIQVIEPATLPQASSTPTLAMLIAGGATLAAAVGAIGLAGSRLGDRKLRRRADIASALGAPILGTVAAIFNADMPARRLSPVRWLLGTDSQAGTFESPQQQRLELIRYSRVLERLHGVSSGPLQLAVVAPDDDGAAVRAVSQFAAATEAGGRPVTLLSDSRELTTALERGSAEGRATAESLAVTDVAGHSYPHSAVLRVVLVPPARPTVPRNSEASGALIVTTSGMRTHWELLAIAEACRDGMLPVLGALVVVPVGAEEEVEAGSPMPASEPASPMAARMNGRGNSNGHATGTKP